MKYHPDRNPDDASAKDKFQCVSAVYKILSDKEARAVYDETGEVNDEGDAILQDDRDWDQYWRLLFKVRVTILTIRGRISHYH